jgi:protein-L-isoaspartate(D-aspartate) O-methyltransferase
MSPYQKRPQHLTPDTEVVVRTGDGWLGAADRALFDRIQATVGVWDLAPAWTAHLAPAGTLVAPLWLHAGVHATAAFAVTHGGDGDHGGRWLRSRHMSGCAFVHLRGPHAGPADIVEVQPGLLAAVDRVDAAELALLRGLLATAPVREAAPPLPAGVGWFARLALDEPGAIQLLAPGDGDEEERRGLFDPAPAGKGAGLGLMGERDGQLATFGNPAPLVRLRAHLTDRAPLDFHALDIEAVPADAAGAETTPSDVRWVLSRPAHRFLIRYPGP